MLSVENLQAAPGAARSRRRAGRRSSPLPNPPLEGRANGAPAATQESGEH